MKIIYHIGLHKTATTWFQQIYFPEHPQLCLVNDCNKPWDDPYLHYLITTPVRKFDTNIAKTLLQNQIDNKRKTKELSDTIVISAERLSGHPYSGGHDRYTIMERIYQVSPDAKILFFYRDQIPMLKSLYKQMVTEGYTGTIKDMVYGTSWKRKGFDLSYLEYDIMANAYIEKFGRNNVLALSFEEFLNNQKIVLSKVCSFLEAQEYIDEKNLEVKLAQRTRDKTIPLRRHLNKFRKTEYVDSPVFILPEKITNLLCRFFAVFNMDIELTKKDREFVARYFELPSKKLDQVLNPINASKATKREEPYGGWGSVPTVQIGRRDNTSQN